MRDDKLSLQAEMPILQQQILQAEDCEQLQKVVDVFNLSIKKKDIIRAGKLSELQDKISEQMTERIDKHAHEFSNKDLLDYFKVIGDTVSKADNLITPESMPAIQIKQNNVNISVGDTSITQDSKEKVMSKVQQLLKSMKNVEIIDVDPVSAEETEETNESIEDI